MSALRTIARWSAGPMIGITLGLVLGTLSDGRTAPPSRVAMLAQPPAPARLAQAPPRDREAHRPQPSWALLASAAGD